MKKTIPAILLTTTLMILSSVNLFAQTRINFRRGASSATISGTISAKGSRSYVIRAGSGQDADIFISPGNLIIFTSEAPKGNSGSTNFGTRSGDNFFEIYNPSGRAVSFRMTVAIR